MLNLSMSHVSCVISCDCCFCTIRSVFACFQSVSSLKARKKVAENFRLIVKYIDISEHLLVYHHIYLVLVIHNILQMQNNKSFCPVCLINPFKVWQDVRITQSIFIKASSMLILSLFQFIANIRSVWCLAKAHQQRRSNNSKYPCSGVLTADFGKIQFDIKNM